MPGARSGADSLNASGTLWVSGYLASWMQDDLPASAVDFGAITHLMHFAMNVKPDASLSPNNLTPERRRDAVQTAHRAGKPIILSVGGWGDTDFALAIRPSLRSAFVQNLVFAMRADGYDGLDLDMEPIRAADTANYAEFVRELRRAMDAEPTPLLPRPLLTAAVQWQPPLFGRIHDLFDQVNIMTYDLGGTWLGASWHNNAVRSRTAGVVNEADKDVNGSEMATVQKKVDQFVTEGVPRYKLGVGVDFYGYVWSGGARRDDPSEGITGPRQQWSREPSIEENVSFSKIKKQYIDNTPGISYHWDESALASYLSVDAPGSENDKFISYTDTAGVRSIARFARETGLGGLIIWELGGGHLPGPGDNRDPLLSAVRRYGMSRE